MKYLGTDYDLDMFKEHRVLVVPSGIGEFQWAWTKYVNTEERFAILGLDGAPRRLHQFCELHPQVDYFGYAPFDYPTIRAWQNTHGLSSWSAVKKFPFGNIVMLACNPHLEAGRPLSDWLPDLPTTYRYQLSPAPEHTQKAEQILSSAQSGEFLLGISCASYRGAEAWNTWRAPQWAKFLNLVHEQVPNVRFVLLGGSWDDLTASLFDDNPTLPWYTDPRGFPPVGRTHFGTAVEILRRLDGYVGFSSGLGHVACHCCACPTFMLWPDHEIDLLAKSWVDPLLLENGFYVPSPWIDPVKVFESTYPWLGRIIDGCHKEVTLDHDDGGS